MLRLHLHRASGDGFRLGAVEASAFQCIGVG